MSEMKDVTIIREANVYFGGAVTSRTVLYASGCKKTLGIAHPGEYTFNTAAPELMEILAGKLEVSIAGGAWQSVKGGESFEVPADSSFTMKVTTLVDYCCTFLD